MGLGELVGKIRQRESIEYASFPIPSQRVVLTPDAGSIATYTPWETYFEVRMTQMHLRNQGEYWRDFLPLGSILLEFTFEGKQQTVPVVVGPDRLKQAQKFEKDDRVSYFNVRIAGPYPYEGDDVSLFVGLFRMQTHDWAKQALGLLENVAEAFDTTRLTSFLDISGPIVGGIEAFLDMDDIEFRVGDQRSFATAPTPPTVSTSGTSAFNLFAPRYIVYIRVRSTELPDQQRTRFWVKDGRLTTGTSADDLEDYRESDFILVQLRAMTTRSDYTRFDFHRRDWKKVSDYLSEGNQDAALKAWQLLIANLAQTTDVLPRQRRALLDFYKGRYRAELDFHEAAKDPLRDSTPLEPVEEHHLNEAATTEVARLEEPIASGDVEAELVGDGMDVASAQ